jgi:hypothetical protein
MTADSATQATRSLGPMSANDARLRCAKRKFMLRAWRAWPCPVHRVLAAARSIEVPVAQLDRAQVS